jgi:putative transposase
MPVVAHEPPAFLAPEVQSREAQSNYRSSAILRWGARENIEIAHIAPGKPWQNGTEESFTGKFRDECLSMECIRSRAEGAAVIAGWRRHYNEVRPHSSLGYLTPPEFLQRQQQVVSNAISVGALFTKLVVRRIPQVNGLSRRNLLFNKMNCRRPLQRRPV